MLDLKTCSWADLLAMKKKLDALVALGCEKFYSIQKN